MTYKIAGLTVVVGRNDFSGDFLCQHGILQEAEKAEIVLDNEGSTDSLRIALECLFIHHSILSLHASCVELGGEAVCFTADSGVGKSTRARAWVDGLGAEFISGDRPAIRLEPGGNLACGVPWDGKEQIFRNVERPLKAILEVRRAPFTRLRRLSPEQAFGVLIRQSFIPMWDADTAALAMFNISPAEPDDAGVPAVLRPRRGRRAGGAADFV